MSGKPKFTPKPWKRVCLECNSVETGAHNSHCWIVGSDGNALTMGGDCEQDIETGKANASLIAAAPDLYEAAKRAVPLLESLMDLYGQGLEVIGWHQNGDTIPFDNFIDDIAHDDRNECTDLLSAIAKAEGREE